MNKNSAILIIDVQVDFCDGGVLAAKDTNTLFDPMNNYIKQAENNSSMIIYTRDWHCTDHQSFKKNGGIWDEHCIAKTKGAEFSPLLYVAANSIIINKGNNKNVEGYSAFDNTNLFNILQQHQIQQLVLCGIAIEYCVLKTAIDSVLLGFNTKVVKNLTRGIESQIGDIERTWQVMQDYKITLI